MQNKKKTVAFTTTIPIEIVLSAGFKPLDLNNIFVSNDNSFKMVEDAEIAGFPRSSCAWIKGLYSAVKQNPNEIDYFIAVTEGDCSNARVLAEIIKQELGIETYIFNFPQNRDFFSIKKELENFANFLNTSILKAEEKRKDLKEIRKMLLTLDELSWKFPGLIKGFENHLFLVSSTDFNGDETKFNQELAKFLEKKELEKLSFKPEKRIKLGFLGVPPIFNPYDFIEKKGGIVIYNEIQREFSMIDSLNSKNLEEQYLNYTYPYSAEFRFEKALKEIQKRKLDGIVHYVQSFCHRQMEDIIFRKILEEKGLNIPVLTIEGDKPQKKLSGRLQTRIEAFIETLTLK